MIGKNLSHYRIVEKLGQGGMGEVFLAEDSHLNRRVAIKVLPDAFARDPERLARFEREAKLLGSLSHPNIAAIHGLENAGGKPFLIMELVEGETLAQRITKGPLAVDEALEVCHQIAEGLECAHEKGIIHRDLKPANIKITPDGKVKVLDFGLAKAFNEEPAAADTSQSPTIADQMTRPGVILGTAAYMSPEQAKGKAVDKRADIWAFGCILYECLTGKRVFEGDTITETLASILKAEPDWDILPRVIPLKIADLLRRCLRRDPKERLHDIADVRIEIEDAGAKTDTTRSAVPALRGMRWNVWIPMVIFALAAGVVLGGLWVSKTKQLPTPEVMRLSAGVEPATQLAGGWSSEVTVGGRPSRTAFALTRDGRVLVYYGLTPNGKTQLYLRKWDKPIASPIPGTEGARFPFLPPDGKWVGFIVSQRMVRVPIEGGTPVPICDLPSNPLYGVSWGSTDVIVYSCQGRLWKVRASGGKPIEILTPNRQQGELLHILPHFLPSGDAVLFSAVTSPNTSWDNPAIEVLLLPAGKRTLLLDEGADAQYVPTGHLLFARRGELYAIPFDIERMEVSGEPTVVVENVMQAMNSQSGVDSFAAQYSFSDSGTLAFVPGGIYPNPQHTLNWVDRKGTVIPAAEATPPYWQVRLSPDGKRVAYCTLGTQSNVWLLDLERGTHTQLTFDGMDGFPIWTPDGKNVTYYSVAKKPPSRILQISANGAGEPKVLLECPQAFCAPADWSPDGKKLVYVRVDLTAGNPSPSHIFVLHTDDGKTEEFLKKPFNEDHPDLSPDGHWLAYESNETGRSEVYVRPFPEPGDKYTISADGGRAPAWNADGSELYYCRPGQPGQDWNVMAVPTITKAAFVVGKPQVLFSFSQFGLGGNLVRPFDTGGRRFLIVTWKNPSGVQPVNQINIVQNWFEELKLLVPAGKK